MSLSLVQLENELLAHLGVDVTDFTNGLTDVDLLLNRSWWQVCDEFKFREKEQTLIAPTIVGTPAYTLATLTAPLAFDALQSVAIEDPYTFKHDLLDLMDITTYDNTFINQSSMQSKPTNYIRSGATIILYPTPDLAYNITYRYWNVIADIVTLGPVIPQTWHEIILYGALWRGFIRLGDWNRSDAAQSIQNELIRNTTPVESKELNSVPTAGLSVLGRDY